MSHEKGMYNSVTPWCWECNDHWPCNLGTIATLTAERDKLIEWRDTVGRGQGCGCNNGDGEEWCVGTCIAKAERDALRTALEAANGMFNEMHPHTQGHRSENCTRRTDFCGVAMVVRGALAGKQGGPGVSTDLNALATALGWTRCNEICKETDCNRWRIPGEVYAQRGLPNWPEDMNACLRDIVPVLRERGLRVRMTLEEDGTATVYIFRSDLVLTNPLTSTEERVALSNLPSLPAAFCEAALKAREALGGKS